MYLVKGVREMSQETITECNRDEQADIDGEGMELQVTCGKNNAIFFPTKLRSLESQLVNACISKGGGSLLQSLKVYQVFTQ